MNLELIKLIKTYLENVEAVLSIFKTKVGRATNGKSWEANIPDKGHYSDSGISEFHRHGTGIWVYYKDQVIDFDFTDLNLPDVKDSHRFISIDAGFLAAFIKSLGIKNERWTSYSSLKEELDELVNGGIVKKIEYKYYLSDDLNELAKTWTSLQQHKL